MSFHPVTLPLNKGLNQGSADFSLGANDLIAATNVVYTQNGAIRGRPGQVSLDGPVVGFDGFSTGTGLAAASAKYQFAGVHTDAVGNIFAQFHGRLFKRVAAQWIDVGPLWSCRRVTYAGTAIQGGDSFSTATGTACMDMGNNFTNAQTVVSPVVVAWTGPTVYNADGSIKGPVSRSVNGQTVDIQRHFNQSVADKANFWRDVSNVRVQICGAVFPSVSEYLLATDFSVVADTNFNTQRLWAAFDATNYYVAYVAGTAPNDTIKVLKVNGVGVVVGILTFVTTSTVLSLCLAVDIGTDNGLLCFTTTSGNQARSEVFALSTLTSRGLNTQSTPQGSPASPAFAVCGIKGGTGYLAWCGHPFGSQLNCLEISTRSMTAATTPVLVAIYDGTGIVGTFPSYPDGSLSTIMWRTVFPPTTVAGRVLMGIQFATRMITTTVPFTSPGTWVVVDITDASLQAVNPVLVAAGEAGGSIPVTRAAVATVVSGSLLFGLAEGVSFSATGIDTAVLHPILLIPQAAPSQAIGPYLYFGGSLTYVFDGSRCYESNWVQGAPCIVSVQQVAGGGSALSGTSCTFAAQWSFIDPNGRLTRSLPSRFVTVTVLANGNSFNLSVTNPLFTHKQSSALQFGSTLLLEIYGAGPNPGANDPLNLLVTGYATPYASSVADGYTVVQVLSPSSPGTRQLYTSGAVLGDERAPADRGIVTVDGRTWTADEHTLYPSHRMVANIAPAWEMEVFPIPVPASYGSVQGLCAFDDKVMAVCDSGCFVVTGPGYDNLGGGPGWSDPQRITNVGSPGPARAVCSHPQGGAFVGQDGLLYGISRSLVVQCMGQAVRDFTDATGDLVYVPAGRNVGWDPSSNPLLVYGTTNLKVLDLATGLWCVWTGPIASSMAGASTGLVVATAAAPYVVQFSAPGGLDLGVAFTMSVRLNPQEMAGNELMSGWGRLRSINPVFKTLGAHTVSVQAYADEQQIKIVDKSFIVGP